MSRLHGKSSRIYIDERDYSGVTNSAELTLSVPPADVTAFADVDATFVEGKPGVAATINGFFSTASPNYDGQSFTDLTTAQQVGIYPGVIADGTHGYEFEGAVEGQPRTAAHGSAIALNVTLKGDGPLVRTIVLKRDTAMAATANGTAYQFGAITASELVWGVVRAFSVTGGPGTLNVKIQKDSLEGMGTPDDVITFAELAAAGVEVKTAAGGASGDGWWRVVVTIAGGGTWDLQVAVGKRPV